jgi:hypothetical protein
MFARMGAAMRSRHAAEANGAGAPSPCAAWNAAMRAAMASISRAPSASRSSSARASRPSGRRRITDVLQSGWARLADGPDLTDRRIRRRRRDTPSGNLRSSATRADNRHCAFRAREVEKREVHCLAQLVNAQV